MSDAASIPSTPLREAGGPGRVALGAVALFVVTALAAAGASSVPGGIRIGIPGAGAVAAAACVVLALSALARRQLGVAVGLVVVPILPLVALAAGLPGAGALTGPPGLALVGAAVVAMLARRPEPAPGWVAKAFFPVVLATYVAVSFRVQVQVGPQGDEPHYLMVADSLWRDGDVSLEGDYQSGRYLPFFGAPLEPHYRVRGKHGEIYSLHAVGLSLLILPAYAAGGYPAASLFAALLAALLAREIRELLRDEPSTRAVAEGVAWVVAFSPPLIHYAGLLFTEVPAALLVAIGLRRGRASREWGLPGAVGVASALAFLPWLNVRYAPLAALLGLFALAGRPRARTVAVLAAAGALSAAALAAYHYDLYGFFDPRRVYGRRPELSLGLVPEGLAGLLLDQEFGLLVYAPVLSLAVPGLFAVLWKSPRRGVTVAAMVGVVLATAASWPMWRGGFNPPGRFLVPLLAPLALGVTMAVRRGWSAGPSLLAGVSLAIGLAGAMQPHLVHRDRDGTAPLLREYSGAEEWTRLLPGYVLADPDRHRLAAIWAVALALAVVPWRRKAASAGGVALAVGTLAVAASLASHTSEGRTGGRDAVRLLGAPALEWPSFQWRTGAGATWSAADLADGPLYEPHRFPDGEVVGARLALPPGRYRLVLSGEAPPETPPPGLEVRPERGARIRSVPLRRGPNGWEARFAVGADDGPVTLRLRDGGPILLDRVHLDSTLDGAPRSKPDDGASGEEAS